MAAFDTTQPQRFNVLAHLMAFKSRLALGARQYVVYRQTFDQLERLTDRELSDIGLGRSDIRDVARKAAQGV